MTGDGDASAAAESDAPALAEDAHPDDEHVDDKVRSM